MKTIAQIISKVINPLTTSLLTVGALVISQEFETGEKILWIVLGLTLTLIPAGFIYYQYKKGDISSLWSPSGQERRLSFLLWTSLTLVFVLLAYFLGAPKTILALGLVYLLLGLLNLMLTNSFKISVHMEMVTVLVLFLILSVSITLIWFVVAIPLVGWSRIYLHHHTLTQVTLGTLAALLIVYFVFAIFGLVTF